MKVLVMVAIAALMAGCGAYYTYEKTSEGDCKLSVASNRSASMASLRVGSDCALESDTEGLTTPESNVKQLIGIIQGG